MGMDDDEAGDKEGTAELLLPEAGTGSTSSPQGGNEQ